MKAIRYFLTVIVLTVLSTRAFAQNPSPEDAIATIQKEVPGVEFSDVRVGKQLEGMMGMKYWPVRAKATYRHRVDVNAPYAYQWGTGEVGSVHEAEWVLFEDGFGGYKAERRHASKR